MPSYFYQENKCKNRKSSEKKVILGISQICNLHMYLHVCFHWIRVRDTEVCMRNNLKNEYQISKA